MKQFISDGIVSDTRNNLALAFKCNGQRKKRQRMHEIESTVDGIDDPTMIGVLAFGLTALFAKETVSWARQFQFFTQNLLSLFVRIGDKICGPLHRNLQA